MLARARGAAGRQMSCRTYHQTAIKAGQTPKLTPNRVILPRQHLSPHSPRSLFIQTEETPNVSALKFIPTGTSVLPSPDFPSVSYLTPQSTTTSPLAQKLFAIDGVRSVMYGYDFITVEKEDEVPWGPLKPEIFSLIMEYVSSGKPILSDTTPQAQSTDIHEDDSETVQMIKELLATRIRPAIQEDGGDVDFRGFNAETGVVEINLRGSCRSCSSSVVTLKNGIESMLTHYVADVKGVEQVMDEEEVIAESEFEKFEQRLREKAQSVT